jgi:dihydroxy-acid dehydratase
MTQDSAELRPRGRRFRSQLWFDNPEDPCTTALYFERYLNFGLTEGSAACEAAKC